LHADREFSALLAAPDSQFLQRWGDPRTLSPEQLGKARHEFLAERGVSAGQIAKDVAIDAATGAVAGYVGGKVEGLREGAKTAAGKVAAWGADVAADGAITLANTVAHKGEINGHAVVESLEAVVVARSVAKVASNTQASAAPAAAGKSQAQPGKPSNNHHGHGVGQHTGSVVDRTATGGVPPVDDVHPAAPKAATTETTLASSQPATSFDGAKTQGIGGRRG
ncbi:MAG: hypothetical protein EBZ48_16160, partial [Proteobacteria bacterium]|nr:hypothetical protein [Pseudomonadota bacterium]